MYLVNQMVNRDYLSRTDVFSYDALQLTARLLRDVRPTLALQVQNILQQIPLCDQESDRYPGDPRCCYFQVHLDPAEVQAIHDAMVTASDRHFSRNWRARGAVAEQWIVVWAVISDWRELLESKPS